MCLFYSPSLLGFFVDFRGYLIVTLLETGLISYYKNKLDCLNDINFRVKLFSKMPISKFNLPIFTDERIPKTLRE